ncbi:hypothetical protein AYO40_01390 [Planctomycetaceae bacterium SCGC AG-212-D15]|nr:hypothetical protein AYO40_01390 [Planctomycetaceae bacterium SCGC AG-212-D15]
MPDVIGLLQAVAAAALTAVVVCLLSALARKRRPRLAAAGTVLGVGLGFAAGCACLGVRPHLPPREDQDRLLLILLPAALLVEVVAVGIGRWAWLLRGGIAAAAAGILLFGSVYLTDLAGPGSREWPPQQAALILGALAAGLLAVWAALTVLVSRARERTIPLALALCCGGAALTVMLSGYASGGQLGVPLAAAVCGVLLASLVVSEPMDFTGATGFAVVGLFALLVIGRFFGQLTSIHAVALFLAPLACWLPELAPVERLRPGLRGFARLVLAAVPIFLVVAAAHQKFIAATVPPSQAATQEGSIEDYMNFGK